MKLFIFSAFFSLLLFNACKDKIVEPEPTDLNVWEKVADLPGYPKFIDFKDNKIYMVYYSSGYKFGVSNDGAKSWQEYNLDFQVNDNGFLNVDGDIFFISSTDGLYKSTDEGVTWNEDIALRNYIDPVSSIPLLTSMTVDGSNIYLGQFATNMPMHVRGILFSSDNGQSWSSPDGFPWRVIGIEKIGSVVLFINFIIHYSADNLNTWYDASGVEQFEIESFDKINSRVYGIGYKTIKYSDTYGTIWQNCTNGLNISNNKSLIHSTLSHTTDKLFILHSDGVIHYSFQDNIEWKVFDSDLPAYNPFPYENQSLFTLDDEYLYYISENKLWRKKISD